MKGVNLDEIYGKGGILGRFLAKAGLLCVEFDPMNRQQRLGYGRNKLPQVKTSSQVVATPSRSTLSGRNSIPPVRFSSGEKRSASSRDSSSTAKSIVDEVKKKQRHNDEADSKADSKVRY